MALQTPPPEIPIVSFLTPNKADQGLLEFWNTEVASYVPLDIGAPHPNTRDYPGFRLGKQAPLQGDQKWILRTWVTDETSPDWFNYALKYSAEDNAYPIFIRTYRERRDAYTPRTKGTPLGTLYKLVLDDDKKGSGYPFGVLPKLVFDDPDTEPTDVALGHAVVSPDGTIQECVIDFGGTGYAADVRFRVEVVGDSNPAEGTAYVQKQTAILTQEQAQLYPEDSPFFAQYLQVARIYEVLPGPFLMSTKLDVDGVTVTVSTRRNLCADINTGEALGGGTWAKVTKEHTDDDFICNEIVTTRAIPGNPMDSTKIDDDGKVITITRTMVDKTTITSEEVITGGGNWVMTHKEDIDDTDLISWKVVQSRPVPGNPVVSTKNDDDGVTITFTKTLKDTSTITTSETVAGGFWTKKYKEAVTDLVAKEVTEVRAIPGNAIVWEVFDKNGDKHTMTRTLKEASAITEQQTLVSTTWTSVTSKPVTELVSWELKDSMQVPGVQVPFSHTDQTYGIVVTGFKQVVPATASGGIAGGFYRDIRPLDDLRSILVASQIDEATLPDDKVWYSGKVHSFPPVLQMNLTGTCPGPLSGDPLIDWAEATCNCSSSFSADLIANIKPYVGEVKTRITEQFYIGPPPDDVVVYQFFPESHNFGFAWASACGDSDGNCVTKSGAPHFYIPPCLHDEVTFCIGSAATWTFPATTPAALPSSTYIMLSPHVEERAFGLFRRVLTEVFVP